MAKRVLAVLGAIAIVLAAVAVRAAWTGGDGAGAGGRGGSPVRLVCDPDLAAACQQLGDVDVAVRDSATLSGDLVAGPLEAVDGWVTSAAWVELTAPRLDDEDARLRRVVRLGADEVVVAALDTRAPVLTAHCGPAPVWRCLGDVAGQPWTALGGLDAWGDVRTGLPDADTAIGLSVLANVAAGYFDGTTFAANDFSGFDTWLARLAEPSGGGDPDVLATLVRRRGTYDAAGVLRHQAAARPEVQGLGVAPAIPVEAVLVELGDRPVLSLAEDLRPALVSAGWSPAGGEPAPVLGRGVVGALHALWKDVAR